MKHWNDISNIVCFLQVVKIYSFMRQIKLHKRASCIVFLFVKAKNNDFIKETKHVLRAFIVWWKLGKVCESSRAGETLDWVSRSDFQCSAHRILPIVRLGYQQLRLWRHEEHVLFLKRFQYLMDICILRLSIMWVISWIHQSRNYCC